MQIRKKLVLTNILVVIFSVFMVAVPVITSEIRSLKHSTASLADSQISEAKQAINSFLVRPQTIVRDLTPYVLEAKLSYEETPALLNDIIKPFPSLFCLYTVDTVHMKNGGTFYSSDEWIPEDDYDKSTRDWYAMAVASSDTIITAPYTDATTGQLVTTVACAVRDVTGRLHGVTGIDITLDELTSMVNAIKLTESGKSFLLDKSGFYLTNDDFNSILTKNFFDDYPSVARFKNSIDSENFCEIDAGDGLYFAGTVVSEDSGWMLVTIGPDSEITHGIEMSILLVVVMSIIGLCLSFLVAFIMSSRMVKPLRLIDSEVNKIAEGNADLTNRLEGISRDEVGSLVKGFNKFIEKLQTIMVQIKDSNNELQNVEGDLQVNVKEAGSVISEIISNIENIGSQVGNQAQAVSQTSAAVAEIAENINSLETMIAKQSDGVTQASSAVEQMIGNINSVNSSVSKMADSFEKLEESADIGIQRQHSVAQQIAAVAEQSNTLQNANRAIANVASQTNLLAMNAAIEAAHAGEAGRGFAVVADEIRKLSETSSEQSKKIGLELKNIQQTIAGVVNASSQSTESFNDVSEMIRLTDELVRQIRAAMEEQQEGSHQIVDSLKVMNDNTVEVRTASKEMAEGNRLILDEIHNLQETTFVIKDSMKEITAGAEEMNRTGSHLSEISGRVRESIGKIGSEIDQFRT